MVAVDTVVFHGVRYRRYPYSKNKYARDYYRAYRANGSNSLHRAIWEFYNGTIPEGYHIHHIDGNTLNNTIGNLECLSEDEHRIKHGGVKVCEQCGKTFVDRGLDSKARFCSNACNMKARRRSGVDDIIQTCDLCGAEFKTNKYDKSTHCSQHCAVKHYWILKKQREQEM